MLVARKWLGLLTWQWLFLDLAGTALASLASARHNVVDEAVQTLLEAFKDGIDGQAGSVQVLTQRLTF